MFAVFRQIALSDVLCVCCIFLVKDCYKYKYILLFCSLLLCNTNICIIFVSTKTNKTT